MAAIELGRLEKVDLRLVFPNEATAFTPWLAEEKNLALLGEAIGLDLELEAQEKSVGPFSADILCKDTATENWVLIENQIEKTDHKHLGQLLTYAAGLDAVTIVWVAERFYEDHAAALDWLNEKTADDVKFFGLEIELWRIGDSEIAPKFNIRCEPNAFVKQTRSKVGTLSEIEQVQRQFWSEFYSYMEESKGPVKCRKPSSRRSMVHPIGKAGFHLASRIASGAAAPEGPEVRVQLIIRGQKRFQALEKFRAAIEQQLGNDLIWESLEGQERRRVYRRKFADFLDKSTWPSLREWLKVNVEQFQKVLVPIIKGLDHSAFKE